MKTEEEITEDTKALMAFLEERDIPRLAAIAMCVERAGWAMAITKTVNNQVVGLVAGDRDFVETTIEGPCCNCGEDMTVDEQNEIFH